MPRARRPALSIPISAFSTCEGVWMWPKGENNVWKWFWGILEPAALGAKCWSWRTSPLFLKCHRASSQKVGGQGGVWDREAVTWVLFPALPWPWRVTLQKLLLLFNISVADFLFVFQVQVVVMNICFLQVWFCKPLPGWKAPCSCGTLFLLITSFWHKLSHFSYFMLIFHCRKYATITTCRTFCHLTWKRVYTKNS